VFHDLTHGDQPDDDFKKTEERRDQAISFGEEDQAQGADGLIRDAREENQQWKNYPLESPGMISHCKKFIHGIRN
jgi:hypothetical protein